MTTETYYQIDQLLNSLPRGRTEMPPQTSFQIMHDLMKTLGSPQKDLPQVIHIAGTNGKGSTAAILESLLTAQCYTVNLYTSPHLMRVTERIRLKGQDISPNHLLSYLEEIYTHQPQVPFNYFHALTAAAFLSFKDTPADFTILETGMGGRFDATNVIEKPLATLFTPISYDHQAYLGTSLKSIAAEKAAIVKAGTPMITTHQGIEAIHVLETKSNEMNAPLLREGTDWGYEEKEESFTYKSQGEEIPLPCPNLQGPHQLQNASLALSALVYLGLVKNKEALHKGLTQVNWPGRLMPYTYKSAEILLDGAHNIAAAKALAQHLGESQVSLVFSMTKHEDIFPFLEALQSNVSKVFCPFLPSPFVDRSIIEKTCWNLKIPYAEGDTLEHCLDQASASDSPVLVTGSLYLVGDVMGIAFP